MTRPLIRFLGAVNSSTTATIEQSSEATTVDSDFVVILAALLCALICVLGLIAVARCAWLRRLSGGGSSSDSAASRPPPTANKGLKKKAIRSLPKLSYSPESPTKFSDCAICLTEFTAGEELRMLPQCGHTFHAACIDTWLVSRSSCPSCRQVLVVARCQKCGGLPGSSTSSGTESATQSVTESATQSRLKESENDVNRFLP